jgi:hypothetical protein
MFTGEEKLDTIKFLLERQSENGSWCDDVSSTGEVFATAFAVLTLLLWPSSQTTAAARQGIGWLIRRQDNDGSWPSVPILQVPPSDISDASKVAD